MNRQWGYSLVASSLLLIAPLTLNARVLRISQPCRDLEKDLDNRVNTLHKQQDTELAQCRQSNGKNAEVCRAMKDYQKLELQESRDQRRDALESCRAPVGRVITVPGRPNESCDTYDRNRDRYAKDKYPPYKKPPYNEPPYKEPPKNSPSAHNPPYHDGDGRHHHDSDAGGTRSAGNSSSGSYSGSSNSHSGSGSGSGGSSGSSSSYHGSSGSSSASSSGSSGGGHSGGGSSGGSSSSGSSSSSSSSSSSHDSGGRPK